MNKNLVLQEKFSEVQENIAIKSFVVSKIGGFVDYFFLANKMEDLLAILKYASESQLPLNVIGAGSKTLFSKYGFPGLIIMNRTSSITIIKQNSQVIVESGVLINSLVNRLAEQELSGLEYFAQKGGSLSGWLTSTNLIYNINISELVKTITVFLPLKNKIEQYSGKWLEEHKTDFIIKTVNSPIILNAKLQLTAGRKDIAIQKINHYSKQNKITEKHIGYIENIFFEKFSQKDSIKLQAYWPTEDFSSEEKILKKVLSDPEISKKIIYEISFIFRPNNVLLIKRPVEIEKILACLDAVNHAVYDKFGVNLMINSNIIGPKYKEENE